MSVYKPKKSPYYSYDFQIDGRRFFGPTKAKTKKEADAVERRLKADAKSLLQQEKRTGAGALILDVAALRYWQEVGQYHAGSDDTWRNLELLITYFGKETRLDRITDREVADLIAWRRSHRRFNRETTADGEPEKLISPSTVNRSTVVLLKAVFSRAKRTWRYEFPLEPNWRDHMLKEPVERIRVLSADEHKSIREAVREDYLPWLEFAHITGLRRGETFLRWSDVDFELGQIRTVGKGGATVSTPITPSVRAILEEVRGQDPTFVFTYVCRRNQNGKRKGKRYPITAEGAKSEWRRLLMRAGVSDLRFHDLRHDMATTLLRECGNLKIVQRALNHADIKTTTKYAHVLDDEVAHAIERATNSRKKYRTA